MILDPADVNQPQSVAQLKELEADLFVVCDFGQILSNECLGAAKLGGINLHGSLLPKYRGAAPINWAIYNGEPTTGITIIHMTPKLDGGPCLVKSETEIGPTETTETIEPRLALLGVQPVHEAIAILAAWDGVSEVGEKQDRKLATKAPRLKKSDGQIDWTRSATEISNQIRAFQPWPGSYTNWHSEKLKQPMRLIIHLVKVLDSDSADPSGADLKPGQVISTISQDTNQPELIVQTGAGQISIEEIQPAGKRKMPVADFLRGKPPEPGELFSA